MSFDIKNPFPGWKFRNGDMVFRQDGSQINPSEPEGKIIQRLWDFQGDFVKINKKQSVHFAWVTYPNDPTSRRNLLTSWGLDPDASDPGPQPTPTTPVYNPF